MVMFSKYWPLVSFLYSKFEQSKCPSLDETLNELLHICTVEYCLAVKSETLIHATTSQMHY